MKENVFSFTKLGAKNGVFSTVSTVMEKVAPTEGKSVSVPPGKKWAFSALREIFCSRITFNRRARRKVLFVPNSETRFFPKISRFSGKTEKPRF